MGQDCAIRRLKNFWKLLFSWQVFRTHVKWNWLYYVVNIEFLIHSYLEYFFQNIILTLDFAKSYVYICKSMCAMLATFVAAGSCASSLETHNGVAFSVLIQVILAWTCNNILQLVKAGSVFNFDFIIYSLTVLHCFTNNYTAIQQAAWEQHENCDLMLR